jgi:hypothetical protein
MSRQGKQTEMMRKDGYVTAAEVARAIGIDLSTAHNWIQDGRMPGGHFGWGWYVDIWTFVEQVESDNIYPQGSTIVKQLKELKLLVGKRAQKQKGARA